jgi:hypothetical protein
MSWRPFRRCNSWLRRCPMCRSTFVVPVDFHVVDEERWWIRLRCGECERARDVTLSNEEAQRYERELDRSVAKLRKLVRAVDREAMEQELTTLVSALARDLIGASDFTRGRA